MFTHSDNKYLHFLFHFVHILRGGVMYVKVVESKTFLLLIELGGERIDNAKIYLIKVKVAFSKQKHT